MDGGRTFQFVDNSPEALQVRKMQQIADNIPQQTALVRNPGVLGFTAPGGEPVAQRAGGAGSASDLVSGGTLVERGRMTSGSAPTIQMTRGKVRSPLRKDEITTHQDMMAFLDILDEQISDAKMHEGSYLVDFPQIAKWRDQVLDRMSNLLVEIMQSGEANPISYGELGTDIMLRDTVIRNRFFLVMVGLHNIRHSLNTAFDDYQNSQDYAYVPYESKSKKTEKQSKSKWTFQTGDLTKSSNKKKRQDLETLADACSGNLHSSKIGSVVGGYAVKGNCKKVKTNDASA